MSLAREIFDKMLKGKHLKGESEPLPLETPVKPSQAPLEAKGEPQGSLPLIQTGGKAKKAKMAPVKIFSKLFHEEIWVVADQEEMEALVSKGVKEIVYMAWEIPVLKGMDKERLRAVHLTKKVFPGSAMA
jgi:hypothetical protein